MQRVFYVLEIKEISLYRIQKNAAIVKIKCIEYESQLKHLLLNFAAENEKRSKKMKVKRRSGKALLPALLAIAPTVASAGIVKGKIIDKNTGEPLPGVTVQVVGTDKGAISDMDGQYTIDLSEGQYTLKITYVGYSEINIDEVKVGSSPLTMDFAMTDDALQIAEVGVTARKNLESERILAMERMNATAAIENLGAKEMSIKGISDVQEGVTKLTGISIADAGQLIVRGLGDRYSTTTLNGLPIASPNPDNKLIPLDLFPASTVRNITVSKVYEADVFADYSGAHIDISTKENTGDDFFNISINTGGKFNTLFQDFYTMDRKGTLLCTPQLGSSLWNMPQTDFEGYVKSKNPFNTSFQVSNHTSIPELGGNIAFAKSWRIGTQTLSLMAAGSMSNNYQTVNDGYARTLEAGGYVKNRFDYDSYSQELKSAALINAGYTLRKADRIGYTFFYARNAVDTYMRREGYDYERNQLVGINDVMHIYSLMNHQLHGHHEIGNQWSIDWNGSYSSTGSDEPDRRQLMFEKTDNGLEFFTLNRQENMRYFGELDEKEWVGDVRGSYKFGEKNKVRFGAALKDKKRDYRSTRFYYNLNSFGNTVIENIYDTEDLVNYDAIADSRIEITHDTQPKNNYWAGHRIWAGFADAEYYPIDKMLVSLGLRYEHSSQWVDYYTDGGEACHGTIDGDDLFPALNMKYSLDKSNSLRFAFSRTVTRPSFIEMAPFLYQESYGSTQIRGNADLRNGYNYNFDLKYEFFEKDNPNNMFAVTGYAKILQDPIERTQDISGGAAVHSFHNADTGVAAGVEIEARRELLPCLKAGINASFMYTNVTLPENSGSYTNSERSLQGASPYLVNADVVYTPKLSGNAGLSMALLYNLQGPRIHAVGISGLGDVMQEPVHTLDFNATYNFNSHFSIKLQAKDILNQDIVFKQEISDGSKMEVERYRKGAEFEIGITYKL